ncbi:MAG: HNH endonuclease [Syntrophobacteraceae bacterium]
MARRSKRSIPETLRSRLVDLLTNFKGALQLEDLRQKVLSLVPAYHLLRDLGTSLTPSEAGKAARDRILFYLLKYPYVIIDGDEIMVVAGISDWPRRVRELRKELGWKIISGQVAKEMAEQEEFSLPGIDVSTMKTDDYILTDERQDREAAFRWKTANNIRRKRTGVINKILEYMLANVGNQISGEELRYVANDKTEWARRARELRTDLGWQVVTRHTGLPDLPVGVYLP